MRFVALDCETANHNPYSICQVGAVVFEQGKIVQTFSTFVNPLEPFNPYHIKIHGIRPEQVMDSPVFEEIIPKLSTVFSDSPIVHYGSFDRIAFEYAGFPNTSEFFDITRVVKNLLEVKSGYKLPQICELFNIQLDNHHDALKDAVAAGWVFYECISRANCQTAKELVSLFEEYEIHSHREKSHHKRFSHQKGCNISELKIAETGILKGETVCFTGDLQFFSRVAAQETVAKLGGMVSSGVTKKTTMLVVGYYETMTTKEKRAYELIEKGQKIKIIHESEFLNILNMPL